jgi:hypothetical protein
MAKGFYSLVQYCPDRFRAETVNVGLVLMSLEPHEVRVQITEKYNRAGKLFSTPKAELKNLKLAASGLKCRIESAADELQTVEAFAAFAASRANDLQLTEPRLAKVGQIDDDFARLFSQLVETHKTEALAAEWPAEILPPKLNEVFGRLQREQKIWKPGRITVPVFKRKMDIPYAFKNGVVNLVKPKVFSGSRRAESQAATLAVNGDLIQKHHVDGEAMKLIVVSTNETPKQAKEISDHVEPLFREYGVRLVRPNDVNDFASEVEQSAH